MKTADMLKSTSPFFNISVKPSNFPFSTTYPKKGVGLIITLKMNCAHYCWRSMPSKKSTFFQWRRAPQQTLRTHRSLKSFCATIWWRWWLFFILFQVVEHGWNEIDRGKPKYSGKKPVPVPLCPPQIPPESTWEGTRASAVEGRRLTAWAMARP
jgi:hypothetical protein